LSGLKPPTYRDTLTLFGNAQTPLRATGKPGTGRNHNPSRKTKHPI
jgi:hypothetical protein